MTTKTKINNNKKVGLALSGGSALGVAHLGVIQCLKENNIEIDCVAGTSAGSVVAACLAFNVPVEKIIEVSKKMSWGNISDFGFSQLGFNSNEPLGEIMKELLGNKKIEQAKIPLAIIAADIDTGEEIIFKSGSVAKAVMASTCIPAFFTPVKIGKRKLVDGGIVENLPFSPLKEMGAEIEIGVNLGHYRTYVKTNNVLDVLNNSYGILIGHQAAYNDAQICGYKQNDNAQRILIEPHLENYNPSDFDKVNQLLKVGKEAAQKVLPIIEKMLAKNTFRSWLKEKISKLFFSE